MHAEEPTCVVCGMPVAESENRFDIKTPDGKTISLCSAIDAAIYLNRQPNIPAENVLVFDYQKHTMVGAATAFHLIGSKLEPHMAMPPSVVSFSSRAEAEKHARTSGGKVLTWNALLTELRTRKEFQSH